MIERDAWIHMVAEDEAEGELREHYDKLRDLQTGEVDHILRIHGQHPRRRFMPITSCITH